MRVIGLGIAGVLLCGAPAGANTGVPAASLADLSLEELMDIQVTSVSKKGQRLFEAPAAVYVLRGEDIRRTGATSIPEALRMVPGLDVARVDANKWAISSRGFNGQFSNKLLVLIDGRSVYAPSFSGVYWDVQDTFIEDIDRIEVVRGPGASLWGANAVNGVINIVTKHSKETQGTHLTAGGGTEDQGILAGRYGGAAGAHTTYRVYAKGFLRDDFVNSTDDSHHDEWRVGRGGFRVDGDWGANQGTLQGDIYTGDIGQNMRLRALAAPFFEDLSDDSDVAGGNLLGRWNASFSDRSDASLQFYYDRTERTEVRYSEIRDTFDAELQHRFGLGAIQEIIWGAGYRFTIDEFTDTVYTQFNPRGRHDSIVNAFVQHAIQGFDGRLQLISGSKFEYNSYTEFEVQPTERLLFMPIPQVVLWAGASRAVRTPTRYEHDIRYEQITTAGTPGTGGLPVVAVIKGDSDTRPEELYAWELGARTSIGSRASSEIAFFYNEYNDLGVFEIGPSTVVAGPPTRIENLQRSDNNQEGETYGFEWNGDWHVMDPWKLHAAYTFLDMEIHDNLTSSSTTAANTERTSPKHQIHCRSYFDVTPWLEFNAAVYYVTELEALDVPSYTRLDLGWTARPAKDLSISFWVYNVFDDRHLEFSQPASNVLPSEIERSLYAQVDWKF